MEKLAEKMRTTFQNKRWQRLVEREMIVDLACHVDEHGTVRVAKPPRRALHANSWINRHVGMLIGLDRDEVLERLTAKTERLVASAGTRSRRSPTASLRSGNSRARKCAKSPARSESATAPGAAVFGVQPLRSGRAVGSSAATIHGRRMVRYSSTSRGTPGRFLVKLEANSSASSFVPNCA
jgi:hypothetical protein